LMRSRPNDVEIVGPLYLEEKGSAESSFDQAQQ